MICRAQLNSSSYPHQIDTALESSIHSPVTPTQLPHLFYAKDTKSFLFREGIGIEDEDMEDRKGKLRRVQRGLLVTEHRVPLQSIHILNL